MTNPINVDTINRLTIAATQRDLTDSELAEYLDLHAAMAQAQADTSKLSVHQVSDLQRKAHALNAKTFRQASNQIKRLVDLDQAVSEMLAGAKIEAAKYPEQGHMNDIWTARGKAMGDVLALIRAGK